MLKENLLVIDRTYELLKWFLGRLAKFPRSHRYGLGQRIETTLYGVFEGLIRARYCSAEARVAQLNDLNLQLEILRMHSRLADELAMLPHSSYEFASREINEIGKMVGGWLKQQRQKPTSSRG